MYTHMYMCAYIHIQLHTSTHRRGTDINIILIGYTHVHTHVHVCVYTYTTTYIYSPARYWGQARMLLTRRMARMTMDCWYSRASHRVPPAALAARSCA